MYGMTNFGKFVFDDLIEWLFEEGFIQSQYQISIYCKYAPDGTNVFVLYYVYDCFYWYTSQAVGKWFMDAIGKRFHLNLLAYAHWFM